MSLFAIAAVVLLIVIISIVVVIAIRSQDIQKRDADELTPPPGQTPTEADVIQMARAGNKIGAIKIYREIHRVGLAEAKDAVENLEAHGIRSSSDSISNPVAPPTDDEVSRLALAGHKIEAIKIYREIHGVKLAEAKTAVEDIMARGERGR